MRPKGATGAALASVVALALGPAVSIGAAGVAASEVAAAGPAATAPACPLPVAERDWPVATPEAEGFDAAALCAAVGAAANGVGNVHGVLVERRGHLVAERYRTGPDTPITVRFGLPNPFASDVAFDAQSLHDVRSITKSVTSLLVGVALAQGRFPPLDTRVLDLYPELADLRTEGREAITVGDLLAMRSGLDWRESGASVLTSDETRLYWTADQVRFLFDRPTVAPPGAVFDYDGGGTQAVADLLFRATGRALPDLARAQLFEPLGIERWEWAVDLRDRPLAFAGLRLRPRDLLKIGRLVLGRGRWRERQVVPEEWIAESLRSRGDTGVRALSPDGGAVGYGAQWWTGEVAGQDRTVAWAAGVGNGGQRLYVVPELDLGVVMTAGDYGSTDVAATANRLLAGVVAAVRD